MAHLPEILASKYHLPDDKVEPSEVIAAPDTPLPMFVGHVTVRPSSDTLTSMPTSLAPVYLDELLNCSWKP